MLLFLYYVNILILCKSYYILNNKFIFSFSLASEVRYQTKTDCTVRQSKKCRSSSNRTMDALFLVSGKC